MSDSFEVVVSFVGDPAGFPADGPVGYDILPERYWKLPYRERPKVSVLASPTDTLGAVLQRAADQAGTQLGAFVGFYAPEDEVGGPRQTSPVVPLVDKDGHATWGHLYFEVRYQDLLDTSKAGALAGDPLRPYLVLQHGIGNGILPDWHTVKAVWDAFEQVLNYLATAGGAALTLSAAKRVLVDRLRSKSRAARDVIETRSGDWASRNGEPYDLQEWLDDRPWMPEDLSPLLGCSTEEAEAVLWCFGFAPVSSGLWRSNADEEARLLGETTNFAIGGYLHEASEDQIRQILREELEHYLRTGQARHIDWNRFRWLDPPSSSREKFMRVLSPLYHARAWLKDHTGQ